MTNIDIRISLKKMKDYSAKTNLDVDKETLLSMVRSFANYVLELYGRLIEEAINSRRYKGNWEPVEEEGYKEYLGLIPTTPIIYFIRESLEVKKIGNNLVVRIDPSYDYPGTNIPLARVLRAIDSGTLDFNARPILAKIVSQIRSHIMDLWRGYLNMKGVS